MCSNFFVFQPFGLCFKYVVDDHCSSFRTISDALRPGPCENISLGLATDHIAQNTRARGGKDGISHRRSRVYCLGL